MCIYVYTYICMYIHILTFCVPERSTAGQSTRVYVTGAGVGLSRV